MRKVLFWDFHGTLTYPDSLWSYNVYQAAQEYLPDCHITFQMCREKLDNDGFPWHHPERSYLDIIEPKLWWKHINQLFYNTYIRCGLTHDEAERIVPFVREKICDPINFHLYEDAKCVLTKLKERNWHHIMVSNNFPELEQLCNQLGIAECFDRFIVSALVGYDKPRKEIFDIALAQAGYPEKCFMIGDNPYADIEGAKNAGIRSILVNSNLESNADYSCENLNKLLSIDELV